MPHGHLGIPAITHAQVGAGPGAVLHQPPGADETDTAVVFRTGRRGALGIHEVGVGHDVFLGHAVSDTDATPFWRAGLSAVFHRIGITGGDGPGDAGEQDTLLGGALGEQTAKDS